jgi:two-component system, chemotaxis family, sensor histidine kinase and response regulator PixL
MCDFLTRWFSVPIHSQSAMTTDPAIREQTYQYFLQEAPELLQTLEQGLLSLKETYTINQVNNLMRATHTLKGAATSVELSTIATVAHSLEDIFRALFKPDILIDSEVEALLFEGFECLRLPLTAELTGGTVDHTEILDRAAVVFTQIQEKLGDCFDQSTPLPTSAELGFDITQSIFETGVEQRLSQLAAALDSASPDEIATLLRAQADVFLGLAESLNLSGFGAIAQATITALDNHPDQAVAIAQAALNAFREGQIAVLAGDRSCGGQPSAWLQQLADLTTTTAATIANSELSWNAPQNETASNQRLENIWGGQATSVDAATNHVSIDQSMVLETTTSIQGNLDWFDKHTPSEQAVNASTSPFQKEPAALSPHVRISLKHLDQLNYSMGELLTNQSRQSLQTEQLQTNVQTLLTRLNQQQQLLNQLREHTHQTKPPEPRPPKKRKARKQSPPSSHAVLVQSLLDNLVQLTEAAEAVELFTRQSSQILEQQRQLLSSNRNSLIEARMLPLSEIFGRFPRVLQQLETLHNKRIALDLRGTEVLVDKVVAEKLYDPLLHLIRNAFDHGIEPVEVRQQRGKEAKGQIEICAHNQGRYLVIEVRDDGRGLDFDQIRQRAVEKQRFSPEDASHLNQTQLIDLLFEPGFSTVTQVSDLSGRGIGLDVVRNQLTALQGSVTVHSMPHQGTTFTLQIPLSLSIAQLLVCKAGSKTYALLDDAVEQILIPQSNQIQERNNCKVLLWSKGNDKQLVPIHSLANVLHYGSTAFQASALPTQSSFIAGKGIQPVILIRYQEHLLGFEVDQLIGEQELVIRPFGTLIDPPNYVNGASVLADGQLTLIIDGTMLLQKVLDQKRDHGLDRHWAAPSSRILQLGSVQQTLSLSHTASPTSLPPRPETQATARILVVEDSITTRHALTLALQKVGYQVFQAKDGQEGIEQLQHQAGIQLVICDVEMPRVNGFEFLRHCQQRSTLAGIPVITLTSRNDAQTRLLASQLGAAAYMTKPYMEHKLLVMVANLLERTMMNAVSQ